MEIEQAVAVSGLLVNGLGPLKPGPVVRAEMVRAASPSRGDEGRRV